ncbi:hypothetical protein C4D60_Mb04t17610 [Musa balbisiana]|uniref:Uncharacterized protein n=1 Tax=Musa balbisiana TaxID=52838 RepID=A0A4S8KCU5_MUSBA|nr:hypothetical protein C4D60_Mb04t17610 [Musa balbisiana]
MSGSGTTWARSPSEAGRWYHPCQVVVPPELYQAVVSPSYGGSTARTPKFWEMTLLSSKCKPFFRKQRDFIRCTNSPTPLSADPDRNSSYTTCTERSLDGLEGPSGRWCLLPCPLNWYAQSFRLSDNRILDAKVHPCEFSMPSLSGLVVMTYIHSANSSSIEATDEMLRNISMADEMLRNISMADEMLRNISMAYEAFRSISMA